MNARQEQICRAYNAKYLSVLFSHKVGIARNLVAGANVVNGLRHPPVSDMTGWFLWAGDRIDTDDDFFESVHVEHLIERCPVVLQYLGLAPGWRFLLAENHVDAWFDASLLDIGDP